MEKNDDSLIFHMLASYLCQKHSQKAAECLLTLEEKTTTITFPDRYIGTTVKRNYLIDMLLQTALHITGEYDSIHFLIICEWELSDKLQILDDMAS